MSSRERQAVNAKMGLSFDVNHATRVGAPEEGRAVGWYGSKPVHDVISPS